MSAIDLRRIIEDYPECVSNGAKLKAILLDLYPHEQKWIINTLVTIVNSSVAAEIYSTKNVTEFEKSRWKRKLENEYGLSEKSIRIAMSLFLEDKSESFRPLSNDEEALEKIFCPECGKKIEDIHNDCPNCGCPYEYFEKASNYIRNKEYIYCSVVYVDSLKYTNPRQYYYISDDDRVRVGQHAMVTVGLENEKKEVVIRSIKKYKDNYPFPPERTKHIIEIL